MSYLPFAMIDDAIVQLEHRREMVQEDRSLTTYQRGQRLRRIKEQIEEFNSQRKKDGRWKR